MIKVKSQNIEADAITEWEKINVIPILKKGLIQRHLAGRTNEISGSVLREQLQRKHGVKLSNARLRKLLYHVTIEGLPEYGGNKFVLCANHKGYYLTRSPRKVREYLKSLRDRVETQMFKIEAIERDVKYIESKAQQKMDI